MNHLMIVGILNISERFSGIMSADDSAFIKSAHYMIERYGDRALKEVDQRITELHDQGQTEAHELWIEIRKALIMLTQPSNDPCLSG